HGAYASATGIVRTARQWLEERNDETILRNDPEPLSARRIQQAATNRDAFALELFEYTGTILGQTLADAVAITSPQAIIFFGGLAQAGDLIIEPAQRHMEQNLLRIFKNKVMLMQ